MNCRTTSSASATRSSTSSRTPTTRSCGRTRSTKGAMALIDEQRADALYGAMPPGDRGVRRLGGQHHGRHRLARRPRRATSARCATTSSARCSRTTSAPSASRSTRAPAAAGPPTGALPDLRHARRAAHDADLPRRVPSSSGRTDIDGALTRGSGQITYLEGYLWDPPDGEAGLPAAPPIAHARRAQSRAHAVRPVLRRAPPRVSSSTS